MQGVSISLTRAPSLHSVPSHYHETIRRVQVIQWTLLSLSQCAHFVLVKAGTSLVSHIAVALTSDPIRCRSAPCGLRPWRSLTERAIMCSMHLFLWHLVALYASFYPSAQSQSAEGRKHALIYIHTHLACIYEWFSCSIRVYKRSLSHLVYR